MLCSIVLDDKVLVAKKRYEAESDLLAETLTRHPLVKEAMKKAMRELFAEAGPANGRVHKSLNAFITGVIHEEVGTEKAFTFWRAFGRDRHT